MRLIHIENRIDGQRIHMEFIAGAVKNLMSVGNSNISTHRVEARRTALEESWSKFSLNHEAIRIAVRQLDSQVRHTVLQHSYFTESLYGVTQEGYLEALEKMNSLLEKLKVRPRSPSVHSGSQASGFTSMMGQGPRLPQLNLPTLDGSPSDWLPFKDLFDSMVINNPNLSPVWKLHYLKQSLKGTAAQLLKNTSLTSENFQKAWDSLVSFYENRRLLVNTALHSLMTIKRMTKESAVELESLYSTVTQIYRTLETLGRPVHTWDDILVFIAVQRLDSESVRVWEHQLGSSKEPPSWKELSEFLMTRLLTLQAVEKSRKPGSLSSHQQTARAHLASENQETSKCTLCSANHYISRCPTYSNETVQRRLEIIEKNKLCYNCLGQHRAAACRSTKRCNKCGKKHHSTIHRVRPTDQPKSSSPNTEIQANVSAIHHTSSTSMTLLATAQLIVISDKGEQLRARAFIDPGSQISFISERLAQRLHLPRQHTSLRLKGIGAVKAGRTRGVVSITLKPHFNSPVKCVLTAHLLSKLTSKFASTKGNSSHWSHLEGLQLADPEFLSPGDIDVIIGADYYGEIILEGVRRGPTCTPTAQATIFGWVINGRSETESASEVQGFHISIEEELHDLFQKFWQLDKMPVSSTSTLSIEDQECEDHFKTTHSRDDSGRYIVRLPFKKTIGQLGDSKFAALRMLSRLSKRLEADPALRKAYADFLQEYETLDHMKMIPESNLKQCQEFYLPHHGVIRASSLTTKLRVVFNASSRSSTGVSLNDILHTGVKLQTELIDVMIRFRQFRYVFTSDMEKMYRQIKMHPKDRDFQKIFWKNDHDEIITYHLTTVTYGLACAPFLALRTMQQLIEDEGSKFPLATATLSRGRYVDDLFGGADSIQATQDIVQQVNELCMAGGFSLQKWISNHPMILRDISSSKQVFSSSVPIDKDATVHALGMGWNPSSDSFHFTWETPSLTKITKRTVLSTIARLFDPFGFLAPIIINAKIFIQELWLIKLEWDDVLPIQLCDRWIQFSKQLEELQKISLPRWIGMTSQSSIEIHGFSDASQQAIAAVVYARSTDEARVIRTALICSKTKVAPLKKMTIPRLELSAAVLLAKLVQHVMTILDFDKKPVHLWTDSAIVHTWVSNHPSRWKEFIHNRVCFIQESIPTAKWHFIPGKENPADCATRGMTPTQLSQHKIWWSGPSWLQKPTSTWPNKSETLSVNGNLEERPVQCTTVTIDSSSSQSNLLNKYSDLTRLLRITALCKRFISRLKQKAESLEKIPLTTQELEDAKHHWVRETQLSSFGKECKLLSKGDSLSSTHHLARLTPFLDTHSFVWEGDYRHLSFRGIRSIPSFFQKSLHLLNW